MQWRDVLAEVVQAKERFVISAVRRVLGSQHAGCQDDVVQDVFARVDEKFESWLWKVTTNVAHEHRRKCEPFSAMPDGDGGTPGSWMEIQEGDDVEEGFAIQSVIAALPDDERKAYRLVKIEKQHIRPVAKKLRCSVGHVCDLVRRADAKIHRAVGRGVLYVTIRTADGTPARGVRILLRTPNGATTEPTVTDRNGQVICTGLVPGDHALQLGDSTVPDPVKITLGKNTRRYKADSEGTFVALQDKDNARS